MADFVAVGHVGDVQPGQLKTVTVSDQHVLIANWAGTLFATQDLCTHDGGTLADGELVDGEVECPRHGGRFKLETGAVAALTPMFPINTFPIKIEGDIILVAVE